MATLPMKQISGLPGLEGNTYTFVQLDDTLAVTGKAADAKATGDEIGGLKSAVTNYLIFSKAGMVSGAKTTAANAKPVSVSDNKFKCCDFVYDAKLTKNAFLCLENNTSYQVLGFVVARDVSGVQIGASGWYLIDDKTDILESVSSYLANAKIISFTYCFTSNGRVTGITAGIETFDYNLYGLPYKVANSDYIEDEFLKSSAEIMGPEIESVSSTPGAQWYTFKNILKPGMTYILKANTGAPSTSASFAVVNILNNKVTAIYESTNKKTVTVSSESYILFTNVKYGTGTNLSRVWNTSQTLSVDTVVSFGATPNTNFAFDFYVYSRLTPEYIYNALENTNAPITIVDINGTGNYTSINSAIDATNDGDTILIMPGLYNEKVKMWGKNRHLVGVSKESVYIVSGDRYYGNEPLQANIGSVENVTLIAGYGLEPVEGETQAGNYALHIEYANTSAYELVVRNCNLISNVFFAVGAGIRYNQTVKLIDCYMETKQQEAYSSYYADFFKCGGLFFHNDASGSNLGVDGRIEVTDCEMKGVKSAVAIQSQNNGNTLHARFVNCLGWSTDSGKTNAITIRTTPTEGHIAGSDVILDAMSFGNNLDGLNAE